MNSPPPCVRAALGSFEAMRRLGFQPEDIFLVVSKSVTDGGNSGPLHLFVQVRRYGQSYSLDCGRTALQGPEELNRWADAWNDTMTDRERALIWQEWKARDVEIALLTDLVGKGLLGAPPN